MCTFSPEGQLYPGLHQKQCELQGKGGDFAPLLCPCEIPSGVLSPDLEASTQEEHRPVTEGPEQGHEDDRWMEHLSYEGKLREFRLFSLGKKFVLADSSIQLAQTRFQPGYVSYKKS